jgi:hypothetical protein
VFAVDTPGFSAVRGRLKVSSNGYYLHYEDGAPSFYLGDTAWELLHRLNREQVILAQIGALTVPNPYEELPLGGEDPARPNEAAFRHVDYVVNKAESLGMYVGLLPTLGSYWNSRRQRTGRVGSSQWIMLARIVSTWASGIRTERLSGSWAAIEPSPASRSAPSSMPWLRGLEEGDRRTHLKTFHPIGPGMSSSHLHEAPWLDFNMYQSSHGAQDHDKGLYAEHDWALQPPKPTLDGEPRYEPIPVGFTRLQPLHPRTQVISI